MMKTLSGGERKRTAIGVELICDPKVILLDEPTSGLDSFTAVRILKSLQDLARKSGKTIVSTIHQPSSEAFSYCDRLILLADGHVVYQGRACDSADYFRITENGGKNCNPCDYFMRELSVNYPKKEADEAKILKYTTKYREEQEPEVLALMKEHKFPELDMTNAGVRTVSFWQQHSLLLHRAIIFIKREPKAVMAKLF